MKDVKNIETHFPDKRSMIVKLSEYTPSTNSFDPPMTLGKPKEDPVCMAMDGCIKNVLSGFRDELFAAGAPAFLGYAMLSNVSQEALIRAGVETIADEMTRKFIQFTYDDDDGKENHEKEINEIETEACRFKIKERFNLAAQKDGYFGGCLAYIDMGEISDAEKMEPLVLDTKTFKKGSFRGLKIIEPINIYAGTYNTSDPTDEHYFNPEFWYILGKPYHASRFLYFASNPAPLLLKPAYNFFGIPRAQMALDYVAHFVENRESAQNLLNKFSLTCWKTDLTQMLQGEGINSIMNRVKGFNAMRHNGGSLVVDKETEDIVQINTPLGGVREIVDMSLNLLTAVWRIPKIKYIGEGEGGLNASSKEQMRSFYDFILSQKEKMFTEPMEKLLKILQLNLGKEVNEAIGFKWPSMVELDDQDRAALNKQKADRDIAYINAGVLSQEEVRQALSLDSNSDYAMIDVDDVPEQENMGDVEKDEMAQDAALAEDGRWITIGHRDPEGENDEGEDLKTKKIVNDSIIDKIKAFFK
jgi:phage-related protein (TIGR01555 family)